MTNAELKTLHRLKSAIIAMRELLILYSPVANAELMREVEALVGARVKATSKQRVTSESASNHRAASKQQYEFGF